MKKIVSGVLVAALSLSLMSCGNTATDTGSADTALTTSASTSSASTSAVSSVAETASLGEETLDQMILIYAESGFLSSQALSSVDALNPPGAGFEAFYLLMHPNTDRDVPQEVFESFIQQYFDASTDVMRQADYYNAQTKSYNITEDLWVDLLTQTDSRFVVDSVKENGDEVTVEYHYIYGDYAIPDVQKPEDTSYSGKATLKKENGKYKFVSTQDVVFSSNFQ